MRNLLKETIQKIEDYDHTTDEVNFVTNGDVYCNWEDFARAAKNYNYEAGFGASQVDRNLKVVGLGWWLERNEYAGNGWWEYKSMPVAPDNYGEVWLKD